MFAPKARLYFLGVPLSGSGYPLKLLTTLRGIATILHAKGKLEFSEFFFGLGKSIGTNYGHRALTIDFINTVLSYLNGGFQKLSKQLGKFTGIKVKKSTNHGSQRK